jgi:hypothetical protein
MILMMRCVEFSSAMLLETARYLYLVMHRVISKFKPKGNLVWYILDTAWMNAWLQFVHYNKHVSPNPGPCRNDDLLKWDHKEKRWIAKEGLVLSTKDKPGHYCRVSKECWAVFVENYPDSGPTIIHDLTVHAHSKLLS